MAASAPQIRPSVIVHGVPMSEVVDSLDTWRAAAACQKQVAQATEKFDVAGKVAQAGQ